MKKTGFVLAATAAFLFWQAPLLAAETESTQDKLAAFRQVKEFLLPDLKVPTVVEMPIEALPFTRHQFAVFNPAQDRFEPSLYLGKTAENRPVLNATANAAADGGAMVDYDLETFSEFSLPETGTGEAVITLSSQEPMEVSAFTFFLDRHVALPETVEIHAMVDGADKTIVAQKKMEDEQVLFPKTASSQWTISLRYGQPLRIAEIKSDIQTKVTSENGSLRFLAQPGETYKIYLSPDRNVAIPTSEAGDLRDDKGVRLLEETPSIVNPLYRLSDADKDGMPDTRDNCVFVKNPDQADVDKNFRGDACDDFDRDSVINSADNCPNQPNRDQQDRDYDGTGDACDKEESRLTERYAWLPWLAMGGAASLIAFLFISTVRKTGKK